MVEHKCKRCRKVFISKTDYTRHVNRKSPCEKKELIPESNDNIRCPHCDKTYARRDSLDRHMATTCKKNIFGRGMIEIVRKLNLNPDYDDGDGTIADDPIDDHFELEPFEELDELQKFYELDQDELTKGKQPVVTTKGKQPVATTKGKQPVATTKGKQSVATTKGKQPVATTKGKQPVATANSTNRSKFKHTVTESYVCPECLMEYSSNDQLMWHTKNTCKILIELRFKTIIRDALHKNICEINRLSADHRKLLEFVEKHDKRLANRITKLDRKVDTLFSRNVLNPRI